MVVCKSCYVPIVGVMSFSKDKHEKFARCHNCYAETKHQRIKNSELSFGEVLNKVTSKSK